MTAKAFTFLQHSLIKLWLLPAALLFMAGCGHEIKPSSPEKRITKPSLVVLGTLQDGGSPHAGCKKKCCEELFKAPDPRRKVVSLGLIDPNTRHTWLFEATPDIAVQMKMLREFSGAEKEIPDGIFLTHAHIGHYAGLMYLGREAMNANKVPVYAMPRMKDFLETNGPWSQLVKLENIVLREISDTVKTDLAGDLSVQALRVPHRDEFSETVGYIIKGPDKKALFIPDIDKWEKWNKNIIEIIKSVDYAFIDGTFFDGEEISNRNIKEIPHPFISESMELFRQLDAREKNKIFFIHFNHTNPVLNGKSRAEKNISEAGFNVAKYLSIFEL